MIVNSTAPTATASTPEEKFELGNFLHNCWLMICGFGSSIYEYLFGTYGTPAPTVGAAGAAPAAAPLTRDRAQELASRQPDVTPGDLSKLPPRQPDTATRGAAAYGR